MTTDERARETFDASKTRDWLTRDLVFVAGSVVPPAGATPYTRYPFVKVQPGKAPLTGPLGRNTPSRYMTS